MEANTASAIPDCPVAFASRNITWCGRVILDLSTNSQQ
jgi:hypothetical protein